MQLTVEQILAILGVVGGIGTWLIRLEGRQSSHERECAQRQKNLDERHATISDTLKRIDDKINYLMEQ